MNMKRILILTLSLLLFIGAMGCSDDVKDNIGIRGEITQITRGEDDVMFIMVEGEVESDTFYDKASIRINKDTVIVKAPDEKISPEELKEGMMVEAVFQGAVAESYPVQGQARAIKVVK